MKSEERKKYDKEWSANKYKKDKEAILKRNKEWKTKNPDWMPNKLLKQRYGITLEEYRTMAANQGHRCKICNTHQDDLKVKLHVDHCHTSNKIRGLLCENCNRGLGMFKDSIDLLDKAKEYLNDPTG